MSSRSVPFDIETKMTVVLAIRAYATTLGGEQGFARLLPHVPADTRLRCERGTVLDWVPSTDVAHLLDALDAEYAPPSGSVMASYGRFAAEHDLTVFHRVFLRMANPAFVVEKSTQYFRRFHTRGEWTLTRSAFGFDATLDEFHIGARYCAALTAYIARLLELVGAKNVTISHGSCAARGDAHCSFRARYR